jgi:NADH-quinone oxidoreductase subunit H
MNIFYLFVFPGFLFLSVMGMLYEWVDRKLYANLQNRVGPPIYQPLADFLKLLAKESISPERADMRIFVLAPVFAAAAVLTSFLYIPIWKNAALFSFEGDLIVVIYLLTIPTLAFFMGAWSSSSPFATVGAVRVVTQLFAYEAPLLVALIAPAILAGTWSMSGIAEYFTQHPGLIPLNVIGLAVALVGLQGKLERLPFDIPEAETEIAGGTFTEYSGKSLALLRLTIDMELVVGSALVSAVLLGGSLGAHGIAGLIIFFAKTGAIVFLLALTKTVTARIRIDQMIAFCWKYLVPLGLLQLFVNILVKGAMQ